MTFHGVRPGRLGKARESGKLGVAGRAEAAAVAVRLAPFGSDPLAARGWPFSTTPVRGACRSHEARPVGHHHGLGPITKSRCAVSTPRCSRTIRAIRAH